METRGGTLEAGISLCSEVDGGLVLLVDAEVGLEMVVGEPWFVGTLSDQLGDLIIVEGRTLSLLHRGQVMHALDVVGDIVMLLRTDDLLVGGETG